MKKISTLLSLLILGNLTLQSHAMVKNKLRIAEESKIIASSVLVESDIANRIESYIPLYEAQRKKYYEMLCNTQWGSVAKQYIEQFAREEKELIDDFCRLMEITEQQFEQCKTDWRQDYLLARDSYVEKKDIISGSWIDARINHILNYLGFESGKIKIIQDNGLGKADMSAAENFIGIKVQSYNALTWQEFDAIALHEIVHILHEDVYFRYIQRVIFEWALSRKENEDLKNNLEKIYKNFHIRRNHFTERRADTLAGLVSPLYALALAQNLEHDGYITLQNFKKLTGVRWASGIDEPNETHPKFSTRAAYLQKLYTEMKEAINKR